MSKLSIVRQTLEEKAIIAHVEEEKAPLDLCMCWPHKITFYIAPKEPSYKADVLNAFMDSLFTDIQPDCKSYFRQDKHCLYTGSFYFDEKIGEARTKYERVITITDADMLKGCEWTKGKFLIDSIEQMDYIRRVLVLPYPSKEIAEEVLHHHLPRWKLDMELIWQYYDERSLWQKLTSRTKHKH